MDAKEQLRRYLEQRKESGERELVLDDLNVDELLRVLGAAPGASSTGRSSPPQSVAPTQSRPAPTPPTPVIRTSTPPAGHASADWRDVLRSTGAAPGAPPDLDTPSRDRTPPADAAQQPDAAGAVVPLGAVPAGITVGGTSRELFGGSLGQLESLEAIAAVVASCTRCPLYSTATNPVPGEGNPDADLMIVGEAPGATEDETGRPFVGAAGQLLTKILAAVDFKREDVFICNVLKHRPPGNRNPMPDEVTACSPYLIRQIDLIRPKAILALGTFAAQTLLQTKLAIGKLRSQVHRYYGVPLIVTYHPAALLRNPSWKRPTWEDVQLVRRILDSSVSQP
ncbi:MAG TPA: uracil-DNA glycosylase family protein [Gemmatimonadaceae bacterium]|nr:uracil-DNA glycosylase family protein [Gemmatimonadaceae bacterium]